MLETIIRSVIEALLGGALIVTLVTLKSTKKKAEEAVKSMELDNSKKLLDSFNEYIVEPLKKEVNGLRKDIKMLNKAIDRIQNCPHAANCPVRSELQNSQDREDDK
ncbi:MAG: hypothetical protein MJ003_04715 [Paludibacteraceae bacterium]|nr:hypothetical protein [Paludibacteraceae bacterium]